MNVTQAEFNEPLPSAPCGYCVWCLFTSRLFGLPYLSLCEQYKAARRREVK